MNGMIGDTHYSLPPTPYSLLLSRVIIRGSLLARSRGKEIRFCGERRTAMGTE